MSCVTTVLYPNEDDATFDMSYYVKTHMPFVQEKWGSYGLKSWEVIQFETSVDGKKPLYNVQATLVWESDDSVKTAVGSAEAKSVFDDVPNFSNKGPLFISGPRTGSSQGTLQ